MNCAGLGSSEVNRPFRVRFPELNSIWTQPLGAPQASPQSIALWSRGRDVSAATDGHGRACSDTICLTGSKDRLGRGDRTVRIMTRNRAGLCPKALNRYASICIEWRTGRRLSRNGASPARWRRRDSGFSIAGGEETGEVLDRSTYGQQSGAVQTLRKQRRRLSASLLTDFLQSC